MVNLTAITKLNDVDIATITRFIDDLRRSRGDFNTEQQAIMDLAEKNLLKIVKIYRHSKRPVDDNTAPVYAILTDKILEDAKKDLLALQKEVKPLEDKAGKIFEILLKIN
jgi:hypothetical protein